MRSSILTPNQIKVRNLIQKDLETTTDTKAYLVELDKKVNDTRSPYYLEKGIESRIVIDRTIPTTPDDLKRLFEDGITLPNVKVKYTTKRKSNIPFYGILANNLDKVIAQQDFNGEPFLKGNFEYMEVRLPNKNITNQQFHLALYAVLNGFKVCTDASKESLVSLANDMIKLFPQWKNQVKVEKVVEKILTTTLPFKGIPKTINIIWNPDYKFTKNEKCKIHAEYSGKQKRNKTFKRLQKNYTEGMTQKQLWEKTNTSRSLVKMYWKSLKAEQLEVKGTGI